MDTITLISLTIGLLGLIATIVGTYLTIISFVNPIIRFRKFLKNPKNWEKFIGTDSSVYFYRHKKYPNFQIVIDWDKAVFENFSERWMSSYLKEIGNNASYYIEFRVNGMLLDKELFVSLDGHRYFVPVPRIKNLEGKNSYIYDKKQIQLSNIIGKYSSFEKDIYGFVKKQENLFIEVKLTGIEKIKNKLFKLLKCLYENLQQKTL